MGLDIIMASMVKLYMESITMVFMDMHLEQPEHFIIMVSMDMPMVLVQIMQVIFLVMCM